MESHRGLEKGSGRRDTKKLNAPRYLALKTGQMMVPLTMMKNMFRKEIQVCLATNLEKYKNQLRIEGTVYNKILSKKKKPSQNVYNNYSYEEDIFVY